MISKSQLDDGPVEPPRIELRRGLIAFASVWVVAAVLVVAIITLAASMI